MRARYSVFADRLGRLEEGMLVLNDGTRWRPPDSGLDLLRRIIKTERDLGRKPRLRDFSEEDQDLIRHWGKFYPRQGVDGGIRYMVSDVCQQIMRREKPMEIDADLRS